MLIDNSGQTQKDGRGKKTANLEWQAPLPGGRLPYKSDGDTRRFALGCKLQILVSLRVLRRKVTIFAHQVSLRAVHKEIYKKCRDASFNMASFRVQFKLDPHPHPGN